MKFRVKLDVNKIINSYLIFRRLENVDRKELNLFDTSIETPIYSTPILEETTFNTQSEHTATFRDISTSGC